jgi:hypothetical protein
LFDDDELDAAVLVPTGARVVIANRHFLDVAEGTQARISRIALLPIRCMVVIEPTRLPRRSSSRSRTTRGEEA